MDIVTHGLASLAIARGFFPRARKAAAVSSVAAGLMADGDWISVYFGPAAFLTWYRTCFHSILAAVLIAAVLALIIRTIWRGPVEAQAPPLMTIFTASLCAALLHIVMDTWQSAGVALLCPFNSRRFGADWLPDLDPWILAILILCIALPELLRLVSSEIGAKSKKPRGQAGALVGLVLIVAYVGARAMLHSNVVAALESRTFHGEPARRASAFPESLSLVTWHGAAETENALNEIEVNARATSTLDADTSLRLFKPQSSPALDAARSTSAAKQFLVTAQIPKASVEKTQTGYIVVLRDLRYAVSGETEREIAALIVLDANGKVTSQELLWARDLPR